MWMGNWFSAPSRACLLFLAFLVTTPAAYCQSARPMVRPAVPPPFFVKFTGPAGMQVTFYPGTQKPQTLPTPCTAGMRPGYIYRMAVTGMKDYPGLALFPTIEVRGTLYSTSHFQARDYPATVTLTDDDIRAIAAGVLITKVITLEDPEFALPLATTADNPLHFRVLPGESPLQAAAERGTPFLIVRIGQRQLTEQELLASGVPGTLLLPGEKSLPAPAVAPCLPWMCHSLYDPKLGPSSQWPKLCLPDGGDTGLQAGVLFDGRIVGLDPADTVAAYTDADGQRKLAVSNRICICIPRYLVFQGEQVPAGELVVRSPGTYQSTKTQETVANKIPLIGQHQTIQVESVASRKAPSVTTNTQATMVFAKVDGVEVTVALEGVKGVTSTPHEIPQLDAPCPLILIKWPDKSGGLIGDIITFTLKYINQGSRPMDGIVVSDNLISRFEYVEGSAQSDRDATFTMQPNNVGSHILRWQINTPLQGGESGIIRFQVRVR